MGSDNACPDLPPAPKEDKLHRRPPPAGDTVRRARGGAAAERPSNRIRNFLPDCCCYGARRARRRNVSWREVVGMDGDHARPGPPQYPKKKSYFVARQGDTVRSRRSRRATGLAVSCRAAGGSDGQDRPPK